MTSLLTEQGWMFSTALECGIFSWRRLRLKRCCRILHSLSTQAFRTLGPMPSGPAALFWRRLSSCFLTWLRKTDRLVGEVEGGSVLPDRGEGVEIHGGDWGVWGRTVWVLINDCIGGVSVSSPKGEATTGLPPLMMGYCNGYPTVQDPNAHTLVSRNSKGL